ncbi:MAG TPA: diadenylate cyclase [Acidimicrobiales bacterium]|nr:diadenylate cyclase [Acidimicrobiales bacterium]
MSPSQLRRLAEELAEVGFTLDGREPWHALALEEIDYALRPRVHERRVPSVGALIEPTMAHTSWEESTNLQIDRRPVGDRSIDSARLYADGASTWLIRRLNHRDEWAVFNRPAGSERDLVVLAEALGAVVVQRHRSGLVRIVGAFGVFRWDGLRWHHEPLVSSWMDAVVDECTGGSDRAVLEMLLEFAVHDLGSRGTGAILVYRAQDDLQTNREPRMMLPPELDLRRPFDLAPLHHVLSQTDGAALVDETGVLREIGVRLVPSPEAEQGVEGFRGMRHTAGRRYSFDDPTATVIVVSEDGPVTVLRGGRILGASAPVPDEDDDPIVDDEPLPPPAAG